jgi:hypothetical protein
MPPIMCQPGDFRFLGIKKSKKDITIHGQVLIRRINMHT